MKSWSEKLNQGHEPRIKILEKNLQGCQEGVKCLL